MWPVRIIKGKRARFSLQVLRVFDVRAVPLHINDEGGLSLLLAVIVRYIKEILVLYITNICYKIYFNIKLQNWYNSKLAFNFFLIFQELHKKFESIICKISIKIMQWLDEEWNLEPLHYIQVILIIIRTLILHVKYNYVKKSL